MAHKIGLTYKRRKATLEISFSNEHTGALSLGTEESNIGNRF